MIGPYVKELNIQRRQPEVYGLVGNLTMAIIAMLPTTMRFQRATVKRSFLTVM